MYSARGFRQRSTDARREHALLGFPPAPPHEESVLAQNYIEIYIHAIFSTKNHAPLRTPDLEAKLFPYRIGIARKNNIYVSAINGARNHVHLLLKFNAVTTPAKIIGDLKCLSTGKMKRLGWQDFQWQGGYGAFSCSKNHAKKVVDYIRNQKEHHKTVTFEQEIERISRIWGISWHQDQSWAGKVRSEKN